jgi:uncharacterized protein (TIGR02679 family)
MTTAAQQFLVRPELARLWAKCRERFERLGGARGTVTLTDLSTAEADALDGMLWPATSRRRTRLYAGGSVKVELAVLDERLRESGLGLSLREALQATGGELRNRRAERVERAAARERVWTEAFAHPLCGSRRGGPATAWLERLKATGLLWRVAGEDGVAALRGALDVLAALPVDRVELSRLAARTIGDTHALDYRKPVSTLVCGALTQFEGAQPPTSARAWRAVWERAGVLCDGLSCTVLTLGVRPLGDSVVAQAARLHGAAGEPYVMTLRSLAGTLHFDSVLVFVCENPAIISAAAERFGPGSPAVVCTSGWPNTAVSTLLAALVASGCRLRVQCDGDREGHDIHRHVRREHGGGAWLDDRHRLGVQEEDVCDLLLDALLPTTGRALSLNPPIPAAPRHRGRSPEPIGREPGG